MSNQNNIQQFRNLILLSDVGGTGAWRRIWPQNSLNCIQQATGIINTITQTPILNADYFSGVNSITVQRWISPQHREFIDKLYKPVMEQNCGWLIYEIDDLMWAPEIPLFNRGRKAFEPKRVQDNIKHILEQADIITVTTDYIRQAYHEHYDIPLEKIVAIPNLLPRYLFDDRFDVEKKLDQFRRNKAKPRIGIVSSLSHYNLDDVRIDSEGKACRKKKVGLKTGGETEVWVNEDEKILNENEISIVPDDLDLIVDMIKETINDFQWVFFGYCPPKLVDFAKNRKIEVYQGTPIMNYASQLDNLQLQAVIAPIQDIEFNRCKSFIKYMECAAFGVPLYASDTLPYNRVVDKHQLFKTKEELKEKLLKLKFTSVGTYEKIITNQWKWLNSPTHEGDFDIQNFWLEDNLSIWIDLFRLRNKCGDCSMDMYFKAKEKKEADKKKNTLFSDANGVEIIK